MEHGEETGGRLVAGRYRLRRALGRGGMGEVWEAYDENLDRRVAVKEMLAEAPGTVTRGCLGEDLETRRERFLREVRTTARIEHPGIPAVYDAGADPATGRLFVAMQLIRGRELRTLIDETDHRADPLPVTLAAAVGTQTAAVLHEVHKHDIVHRDIKPQNLMLTPGGIVKVLDFGVAALLGSGDTSRLTQTGMTVGTPPYMSPEQTLANTVGPTSDVYSLACVLYELLTGRPPFVETPNRSHLWHHVHSEPPSMARLRPDTPVGLAELLTAMLRKDPGDRPDAAEVYERLLPITGGRSGPAPSDLGELDPCLPFARPLGGGVRARGTNAPARRVAGPSISEEEIEEVVRLAGDLLNEQRFTQATDLLKEARDRTTDQDLEIHLSLTLAHALFIAGDFTEAAELFGRVAEYYGPGDPDTRIARYFLGQCRAELGDLAGAIAAFREVTAHASDMDDERTQDRVLDALSHLMRLYAAVRRRDLFEEATEEMRTAVLRYRPEASAALLAEVDSYAARLSRLLGEGE